MKQCISCTKPAKQNRSRCNYCLASSKKSSNKTRQFRIDNVLCVLCGKKPLENLMTCFDCWLSQIGHTNHSKRRIWKKNQRKILKIIWKQQNGKCIYTGEKLIPGINASLDHIIPTSRGGADSLDNVHFTTKTVNQIKSNLTHKEFLNICELISKRNNIMEFDG